MPVPNTFARQVHDALSRLYDSLYLQNHPLTAELGDGDLPPVQRGQSLRRRLLAAVTATRPRAGTPAQSPDWRMFRILELRYIEGLTPNEAMEQLAVSKSQFFRDQAAALEQVTEQLWGERLVEVPATPVREPTAARAEALLVETERLTVSAVWELISLGEVFAELRPTLQRLGGDCGVELDISALAGLPPLRAERVLLRQLLLSFSAYILAKAEAGKVVLAPLPGGALGLETAFSVQPGAVETGLETCAGLAAALGAHLEASRDARQARLRLEWPLAPSRTLLVVDDNPGLIDLYRRYLAGAGWQVVGAGSCPEARRKLAEIHPDALLLDIMLPGEDGWQFLDTLKADPAWSSLPVIVCSVISDAHMAMALGAAGCLAKPVSQEELVDAMRML